MTYEPAGSDCVTCTSICTASAPGGCIHESEHWFVDHCIGPLGVGTLIVKPKRHVVHVADLSPSESTDMGLVLQQAASVVTRLVQPVQVYVTLWSHEHAIPAHIHYVVQPVTQATMAEHGAKHGPRLQVEMFERAVAPDPTAATAFASRARSAWP